MKTIPASLHLYSQAVMVRYANLTYLRDSGAIRSDT